MERPEPAPPEDVLAVYGVQPWRTTRLHGGEESEVWLLEAEPGHSVLVEYPTWRTRAELIWVHRLVSAVQATVPEAIAPLADRHGHTVVQSRRHRYALFPYIEGSILDRDDPSLRRDAAHLLARLHRSLVTLSPPPRPRSGPEAPTSWPRPPDPPELVDPALDALLAGAGTGTRHLITAPIHGDYYRRNLLCRNGTITGIIDWNEAHEDFLLQEVAWSTWEFARNHDGDGLLPDRASAFLTVYEEAGGPGIHGAYDLIVPFIRRRLRQEIRAFLAARARGLDGDAAYAAAECRAFQGLHTMDATLS